MHSKLTIINLALAKLSNGNFVNSLGENSPEAQQALAHWDTTLGVVLSEYTWDFARKQQRLALLDEDTGLSEFKYHYIYPTDCLYIRRIFTVGNVYQNAPFRVGQSNEGNQRIVMTNMDEAAAEYTMASPIAENMPPQFVNAFAWRLAVEIAYANGGSPQAAQMALQGYQMCLDEAKLRDARETGPLSRMKGNWLASRNALYTETPMVQQQGQQ